ncbi:MAG TPA: ester cyclase [Puia sp.]|nr:ester cyclase [Puia sp.]
MRTENIKIYQDYIACLNARELNRLGTSVASKVVYNGSTLGLAGYQKMVADDSTVASRLRFDCRPRGDFQGLPVNGRRVVFYENVFYRFMEGLIVEVWSVVDYKAIENQI